MRTKTFISLFSLAVIFPCADAVAGPKEELVGLWKFKRGVGGPCAAQIVTLDYTFRKDGTYRSKAKMTSGGTFEYSGTYEANDTTCTAFVEGKTVGPYPYWIKNDVLTVRQPEFNCEVQLEREDY